MTIRIRNWGDGLVPYGQKLPFNHNLRDQPIMTWYTYHHKPPMIWKPRLDSSSAWLSLIKVMSGAYLSVKLF